MTIHPVPPNAAPAAHPQQERPDSAAVYDSTWAEQPPGAEPRALDQIMGQGGKIYVVMAVVLIIWLGIVTYLFRTDRKIARLERRLDRDISEDE